MASRLPSRITSPPHPRHSPSISAMAQQGTLVIIVVAEHEVRRPIGASIHDVRPRQVAAVAKRLGARRHEHLDRDLRHASAGRACPRGCRSAWACSVGIRAGQKSSRRADCIAFSKPAAVPGQALVSYCLIPRSCSWPLSAVVLDTACCNTGQDNLRSSSVPSLPHFSSRREPPSAKALGCGPLLVARNGMTLAFPTTTSRVAPADGEEESPPPASRLPT